MLDKRLCFLYDSKGDLMNGMDEILKKSLLYDFYGELLTDRQRHIYEAFVFENLSLSEIAEENGVSRQSIYDLMKRCGRTLEEYEEKLRLVEKFGHAREKAARLQELVAQMKQQTEGVSPELLDGLMQIGQLAGQIMEEF